MTQNEVQIALLYLDGDKRGNISDGYHTFNELYEYRKLYNALLFNMWYVENMYKVHKSKRHGSGEECFGGWLVHCYGNYATWPNFQPLPTRRLGLVCM